MDISNTPKLMTRWCLSFFGKLHFHLKVGGDGDDGDDGGDGDGGDGDGHGGDGGDNVGQLTIAWRFIQGGRTFGCAHSSHFHPAV